MKRESETILINIKHQIYADNKYANPIEFDTKNEMAKEVPL